MVGYTSIEQAKKLVELGIDADTADMYWATDIEMVITTPYVSCLNGEKNIPAYKDAIPCWSTEALLKLLPREINDYSLKDINPTITGKYKISYSYRGMYDEFTITRDTLCECAYETIVKLKELKLI